MPTASNGCSIVGGDAPLEARFFSGRSRRHVRRATSASLVVHARDLSATEEKHLGTEVRERENERERERERQKFSHGGLWFSGRDVDGVRFSS